MLFPSMVAVVDVVPFVLSELVVGRLSSNISTPLSSTRRNRPLVFPLTNCAEFVVVAIESNVCFRLTFSFDAPCSKFILLILCFR